MAETDWVEREIARVGARMLAESQAVPEPVVSILAQAVHYDQSLDRVVVDLNNGCQFSFPPRRVQGLSEVEAATLADMEILGGGYGLHWPRANVSLRLEGLLAGVFGSKKWMRHLAHMDAEQEGRAQMALVAPAA